MIFILTDRSFKTRRVGAYRIASALREAQVEVEVIDFVSLWDFDKLIALLDKVKDIPWIGFSVPYLIYHRSKELGGITDLPKAKEERLLEYLHSRNIPIVIGGANADALKDVVIKSNIIIGYSDLAILALHKNLTEGAPVISREINTNRVIYADEDYKNIELSSINTKYVESDLLARGELIPIEISRGCIFRCSFCEFAYLGKKAGTYIRPKAELQQEIESLYHQNDSATFLFVDDTFNDCIEKMEMIRDIRRGSGIPFKFWSYGRLDVLARHPAMMDLIGEIGWSGISFGVETLNRKAGSAVGKGADPEKLKACLLEIKRRYPEIHLQVNLIVGLPHSTREDIKESIDWFIANDVANYLRVVDLDIRDSSKLSTGSLFSKNPQKFGFKIIASDGSRYDWKNESFTRESAKAYAAEMNRYIDATKKSNKPFHVYQSEMNFDQRVRDYISRKSDLLRN